MAHDTLLTPTQLAESWGLDVGTLANWRTRRTGPVYLRLNGSRGSVRYRLADIEAYEQTKVVQTTGN